MNLDNGPMDLYSRRMAQLNVSMPPALRQWIDARVAEGRYSSASDYVRDLVRRDQDAAIDDVEWLRVLVAEGLASEVLSDSPDDILAQIMAEHPSSRG
ncbi:MULTISPECIES: type II toxin-antitoxin system ParD family antitoxin [unclassified Novosphingobium]|uniref:type II toxin-antitoxin system ParD family antitoxin n=1 Tax=unclassified Novosphingobium TaxID=2644732 RepID=UPI0017A04D64|nr:MULTISPECIES: type II toxin-antitoxin system ParD family antitoxin [unclassified Novosphingobium]MBB3359490.1 antitoxin ParD1/3/4 [Novosphingobium sp. BK256]MBB3375850.1 antitoxin ParD1/3/4 [Novosphingobium sp. BK280]MBB3380263.1 antitoxin ParD1/3/4 [Novosphingobium sp. BK258]MBB3421958.1 antitoxin ParD1/3/4 [Novosphingobium sp. BK267]MBB3450614.1 antitoxin ParD1/3/4 [Novosphingobium sp. BK352]